MARLVLLFLVFALVGCASDSNEPDGADPGPSDPGTDPSDPDPTEDVEPEPVRETVFDDTVSVSAGLDAAGLIGCEGVNVGFTIGLQLGLSLTQGVDYDFFEIEASHYGLDYNFTNQAATDVSLAWMTGNQVTELHRLSGNEVFSGTVPDGVDGGLFAACDLAGASGAIEIYEWS